MAEEAVNCLVISDGRRGIESQALGLAEAYARLRPLTIQKHVVKSNRAFAALPPKTQRRLTTFDLPDCDIVIGCGRQAIAPLLQMKHIHPKVMTVYIQNPRMDPSNFDLVVTPEHDAVRGDNVEQMIGAPHRVTRDKLIVETLHFAEGLSKLPMPRATLLIGGDSKTHRLHKSSHEAHIRAANLLREAGHSLLISASRRTPRNVLLGWKRFASDNDQVWFHDGEGPNPYFAFLGGAGIILVTEDSTNMLTEACGTGKPVFRLPMAGRAGKFQILYDALESKCGVVPYDGQLTGMDYLPLAETARLAEVLETYFDKKISA